MADKIQIEKMKILVIKKSMLKVKYRMKPKIKKFKFIKI
jgi:hypothetical protein